MSSVTVAGLRNVRRRAVRARKTRMDVHTPALQQDSAVQVRGHVVVTTVRKRHQVYVGGIHHVWLQPSVMDLVSLVRHQPLNQMGPHVQTDKSAFWGSVRPPCAWPRVTSPVSARGRDGRTPICAASVVWSTTRAASRGISRI